MNWVEMSVYFKFSGAWDDVRFNIDPLHLILNQDGMNSLHYAVMCGRTGATRALLDSKAEISSAGKVF